MNAYLTADQIAIDFDYDHVSISPERFTLLQGADFDGSHTLVVAGGQFGTLFHGRFNLQTGCYRARVCASASSSDGEVFATVEFRDPLSLLARIELRDTIEFEFEAKGGRALEISFIGHGFPFTFSALDFWPDRRWSPGRLIETAANMSQEQPDAPAALWNALHNGASRDTVALASTNCGLAQGPAEQWARQKTSFVQIDVSNEQKLQDDSALLNHYGLDIAALRINRQDTLSQRASVARMFGDDASADVLQACPGFSPPPFTSGFFKLIGSGQGIDQLTALKFGFVSCVCPFTGRYLQSCHGFPVAINHELYTYYRFEGTQVFYLLVAGFTNRRSFLYIPRFELILKVAEDTGLWAAPEDATWLFQSLILSHPLETFDYLSGPTHVTLLTGSSKNLGHYIWNDLSRIVEARDLGLIDERMHIIPFADEVLSTTGVLNWTDRRSIKASTAAELFVGALSRLAFPVRLAALKVSEAAAKTIVRYCESQLTSIEQERIAQARACDVVLFFNLRAHNKAWVDQVEGAIAIAKKIAGTGRSLALFLDGMPDCSEMAAAIARGVPNNVSIFEGFDVPITATIAWAATCDVYVATIGSGLTLLTWLAGKPGVAHSEHHHLTQMEFWPEVRADVPRPTAVNSRDVVELTSGSYGNYSINPETVADLVLSVLRFDDD